MRDARVQYTLVVNEAEDAQLYRLDSRRQVSVSDVIISTAGLDNREVSIPTDEEGTPEEGPTLNPTLLEVMFALPHRHPDPIPVDLFDAPARRMQPGRSIATRGGLGLGMSPMGSTRTSSRQLALRGQDLGRRGDGGGGGGGDGMGRNASYRVDNKVDHQIPVEAMDIKDAHRQNQVRIKLFLLLSPGPCGLSLPQSEGELTPAHPQHGFLTLSDCLSIDLSTLSFSNLSDPTSRLRVSGPGRGFEQADYVQANSQDLVVDFITGFDHWGRLWTTAKAELYGTSQGVEKDQGVPSRLHETSNLVKTSVKDKRNSNHSNISALSADLDSQSSIPVALKVVVLDSSTPPPMSPAMFAAKDAFMHEMTVYQGALLPLQGKVVPRCHGVFSADIQVEGENATCVVMLLDWLDELNVKEWCFLDDQTKSVEKPLFTLVPSQLGPSRTITPHLTTTPIISQILRLARLGTDLQPTTPSPLPPPPPPTPNRKNETGRKLNADPV